MEMQIKLLARNFPGSRTDWSEKNYGPVVVQYDLRHFDGSFRLGMTIPEFEKYIIVNRPHHDDQKKCIGVSTRRPRRKRLAPSLV